MSRPAKKINRFVATLISLAVLVTHFAYAPIALAAVEDTPEQKKAYADKLFKAQNDIIFFEECGVGSTQSSSTPDEPTSTGVVDESGWAFPTVAGTPISSDYKSPDRPGHRGVDLSAPLGTPIYASRDGTVVASGPASGFGNWIVIQHNVDGKRVDSVYGHMKSSDLMVKQGDTVKIGQQISKIGSEGQSSGPHLHYEEWDGGRFSGGERKPVAVYGQTGKTEPAPETTEPSPVADTSNSNTGDCCTAKPSETTGSSTPLAGSDNAEKVWNRLKAEGLTDEQAAGVMGNLAWESADPTFNKATDAEELSGGGGYGLMQWTGGRRTQLHDAATAQGKNVTDLGFQLDYLVQESKGRDQRGGGNDTEWKGLTEQRSIEEATYYWMDNAERPGDLRLAERTALAKQYYEKYTGKKAAENAIDPTVGTSAGGASQCVLTKA